MYPLKLVASKVDKFHEAWKRSICGGGGKQLPHIWFAIGISSGDGSSDTVVDKMDKVVPVEMVNLLGVLMCRRGDSECKISAAYYDLHLQSTDDHFGYC